MAQRVKNPPAMQETQEMQVRSLGREDPLEKRMATHSSILDWRIPWTEEPSGLQSTGSQRVDTTRLFFESENKSHLVMSDSLQPYGLYSKWSSLGQNTGEGNGNPLQYSCLENLMDREAWWATVHGVAKVGHDLVTKPLNHRPEYWSG